MDFPCTQRRGLSPVYNSIQLSNRTNILKSAPTLNEFEQPIGYPVPGYQPPDASKLYVSLKGRFVELEPLNFSHAEGLFKAYSEDDGRMWTYLSYGPYATLEEFRNNYMDKFVGNKEFKMFTLLEVPTRKPLGCAAYLRLFPEHGSVEIGALSFSPILQRTTAATEALYLMIKHSFDLGFRRCEWKCDSLNGPSERAALRLGFQYEGLFRQGTVYKGRNRDTKWFSILDSEWPNLDKQFQGWLAPENFDRDGQQKKRLKCQEE